MAEQDNAGGSKCPKFSGLHQDYRSFAFLYKNWARTQGTWAFYGANAPARPANAAAGADAAAVAAVVAAQAQWERLNAKAFADLLLAQADVSVAMSLQDYDEVEGAAANARPAQPAQAWEYLRVTYVGLDTV